MHVIDFVAKPPSRVLYATISCESAAYSAPTCSLSPTTLRRVVQEAVRRCCRWLYNEVSGLRRFVKGGHVGNMEVVGRFTPGKSRRLALSMMQVWRESDSE